MAILEDRGFFWWSDVRIPKTQFAPSCAISGTLKIDDAGHIQLEIDGRLPGKARPRSELETANIQGLLKGKGEYVLLGRVSRNGETYRTHNVSYESYIALNCLVSDRPFRADNEKPLAFRSIKLSLKGFEEWVWLRAISVNRKRSRLLASYKAEKDLKFDTAYGLLSVEYDMAGPMWGKSRNHKLALTEEAAFRFSPKKMASLESCQKYYQWLEELVILLTDSDRKLDWPQLISADGRQRSRLYFLRDTVDAPPLGAHHCLVNFRTVKDDIGTLFSNFIEKRERFGPGFYLYLGTRRGIKMFIEHRFVNLIWGLEAFDRRGRGRVQNGALEVKIERILGQVQGRRDRKWLQMRLRNAAEPDLEQRLYELFSDLPMALNMSGLRKFCHECAGRRNDISHFGGTRDKTTKYDDFLEDLHKKANALASLYHLHLLKEIGLDSEKLSFKVNSNWRVALMKRHLVEVGLLKREN